MRTILSILAFPFILLALIIAVAFDKNATYDNVTKKIHGK